jgi:uncharacterized membrane protein YfcA
MTAEGSQTASTPPPFSDPYHHARRAYAAVAGLLLAWEFIGIALQGAGASSFPATLKNPEAAPVVLFALVLYFATRFTVEWHQSDPSRRALPASRFDFWMAHAIGGTSVVLYSAQHLFAFQLAQVVKPPAAASFLLAVVSGFAASEIWRYFKEGQTDWLRLLLFVAAALVPLTIAIVGQWSGATLAASAIGLVVGLAIGRVLWLYRARKRR